MLIYFDPIKIGAIMKCEFCDSEDTFVRDTRWKVEIKCTRRRYECKTCGKKFFTQEKYEEYFPYKHPLKHIKRRGSKLMNQFQMSDTCQRCRLKKPGEGFRMSTFNTDWICPECQKIEESHPDFEKARTIETQHVLKGNYNFKGIGLPNDWKEHERNYCKTRQKTV